ncbi:MAG TPA: oligoendopeptidase F, partial [Spirochaetia bacterium]|nr:oligoendopeptidase F [Spirochaetia bacterium]
MEKSGSKIPTRDQVAESDKWDLTKLFEDDRKWETGLEKLAELLPGIEKFKGTIGESAESLKSFLDFMIEFGKLEERLGTYASLRLSEDAGSGVNQDRFARYMATASKGEALASYQTPEIQSIPDERMAEFLRSPSLSPYGIYLKKILRFKPHVLSEQEERLLALQIEANQTSSKAFGALTDVDMDFGEILTPDGPRPLSQSTF